LEPGIHRELLHAGLSLHVHGDCGRDHQMIFSWGTPARSDFGMND
jgi:hypothetical protein